MNVDCVYLVLTKTQVALDVAFVWTVRSSLQLLCGQCSRMTPAINVDTSNLRVDMLQTSPESAFFALPGVKSRWWW